MSTEPQDLILVATSARALAESAIRGGFGVQVLDGFCDLDTQALAPCTRVPLVASGAGLGLDPRRLAEALREAAAGRRDLGLVYGSGLESASEVLAELPAGVRLLGNDPAVLALPTDPRRLRDLLAGLGIPQPETRLGPPLPHDPAPWLVKSCGGSGGLGVSPWHAGDPRPTAPHLFQRRLAGVPMSVLFIADGRGLALIGYNRLLVQDADPRRPFLYGGAIGQAALPDPARTTLAHWCGALVRALGLRGLNNLDFMLYEGRPYLVDINPRPSATMSLYEGQCDAGLLRAHVRACLGALPVAALGPATQVCGHRILYAPVDLSIPADLSWPDWARDRSAAGTPIPRGAPLCTVQAQGPDAAQVESLLCARAETVLAQLDRRPLGNAND